MKADFTDENTLIITPETTAEMVVLKRLQNSVATVEKPKPFTHNVEVLKLEVVK